MRIATYASENGIAATIRHFKTKPGFSHFTLKESSVRGWKKTFCTEIKMRSTKGDIEPIEQLPSGQVGRPLLLGCDIEDNAREIIQQIRESGGVINNAVVIGIITGILRDVNSNLLLENGGPINVDKGVARKLLERMQYVKQKGTTKAKVTPAYFESLKMQFLDDMRTVVMFEEIPHELIFNWDHTGLNYVPSLHWTLETKGSKKVPIIALDDK